MSIQNLKKRVKKAAEMAEAIATAKANAESFVITDEERKQIENEMVEWHRSRLEGTEPFSVVYGQPPKSIEEELADIKQSIHNRLWKNQPQKEAENDWQ